MSDVRTRCINKHTNSRNLEDEVFSERQPPPWVPQVSLSSAPWHCSAPLPRRLAQPNYWVKYELKYTVTTRHIKSKSFY